MANQVYPTGNPLPAQPKLSLVPCVGSTNSSTLTNSFASHFFGLNLFSWSDEHIACVLNTGYKVHYTLYCVHIIHLRSCRHNVHLNSFTVHCAQTNSDNSKKASLVPTFPCFCATRVKVGQNWRCSNKEDCGRQHLFTCLQIVEAAQLWWRETVQL